MQNPFRQHRPQDDFGRRDDHQQGRWEARDQRWDERASWSEGDGGRTAAGGGFGGGCQTGFIQISGDADALLESVCTAGYGAKYTDRPVGYFYYSGPRANGELTVVGCAGPQQQFPLLGFSVPLTEPGTASATGTYYEASGLDWSSQQDSLTVTIDDFGKEGDTIDGSYEGTFFHDGSPMTVSGTFSVCHVASTGDV